MTALQFIRDGHTAMQAVKAGYKPSEIIMAAKALAKVHPFRFPRFADEASLGAAMMETIPLECRAIAQSTDYSTHDHPNQRLFAKIQAAREYAKKKGRITQAALRREIKIGSNRAREILNGFVNDGMMERDGGYQGIPLEYRLAHLKPRADLVRPKRNTKASG